MPSKPEEAAPVGFAEVRRIDQDHSTFGETSGGALLDHGEDAGALLDGVAGRGEEFATDGVAFQMDEREFASEGQGEGGFTTPREAAEKDEGGTGGRRAIVVMHRMC